MIEKPILFPPHYLLHLPEFRPLSKRTLQRRYKDMREFYNKPHHQRWLTVTEVAKYMNVTEEKLIESITKKSVSA
jgi:hypothetical protein